MRILLDKINSLEYQKEKYHLNYLSEKDTKSLILNYIKKKLKCDYMVYEKDCKVFIGIKPMYTVNITNECTIIDHKNENKRNSELNEENINHLVTELYNLKKKISIFGIINFSLSYKIYDIDNKNTDTLASFFVPEMEVIIEKGSMYINYYKDNLLKDIEFTAKNDNLDLQTNNFVDKTIIYKDKKAYKSIVGKAIDDIKALNYSKVILSRKVNIPNKVNMLKSYLIGLNNNTPARSFLFEFNGLESFGYSPETILEVKDNYVYTFPLAGTRKLEGNENDFLLKNDLKNDMKEIAEHAMSVKLSFLEMEKICNLQSVKVEKYMDVYERGSVQHLGSIVSGHLKEDKNYYHAIQSLFPAVTSTGIPKKESLLAINKYENTPRELYSGGIFLLNDKEGLDVALALRSVFQNDKETYLRAGAGIIKSSNPEREFTETCEKLTSIINNIVY